MSRYLDRDISYVGSEYKVDFSILERITLENLDPVELDLLDILGSVAHADRSVKRRQGSWSRRLCLHIKVRTSRLWKSKETYSTLQRCLIDLTGDVWEFSFEERKSDDGYEPKQSYLDLLEHSYSEVIPFSGGLDSWAHAKLRSVDDSANPLLIQLKNVAVAEELFDSLNLDKDSLGRCEFRLYSLPRHKEPTYRTRPFLFLCAAALCARKANCREVLVTENGQGSLSSVLVPYGRAWPHKGSHPTTTKNIGRFIKACLGDEISFTHRALWQTKGEVIQSLGSESIGYQATRSCPRPNPKLPVTNQLIDCGICTNCLLRRMSLFTAGLSEDLSHYIWEDLQARTLDDALRRDAIRLSSDNDVNYALHAIFDHHKMASVLVNELPVTTLDDVAYGTGCSFSEVKKRISRLVEAHRYEWHSFVSSFPKNSWINARLREIE